MDIHLFGSLCTADPYSPKSFPMTILSRIQGIQILHNNVFYLDKAFFFFFELLRSSFRLGSGALNGPSSLPLLVFQHAFLSVLGQLRFFLTFYCHGRLLPTQNKFQNYTKFIAKKKQNNNNVPQ